MLLTPTPDASAARARAALGARAHVVAAEMHVEFLSPGVDKASCPPPSSLPTATDRPCPPLLTPSQRATPPPAPPGPPLSATHLPVPSASPLRARPSPGCARARASAPRTRSPSVTTTTVCMAPPSSSACRRRRPHAWPPPFCLLVHRHHRHDPGPQTSRCCGQRGWAARWPTPRLG